MRVFSLFVTSKRSAVPILDFVAAADADHAREIAARRLFASEGYLSVEVRDGDELVCAVRRREQALRFSTGR